jgi:hypothetical protein
VSTPWTNRVWQEFRAGNLTRAVLTTLLAEAARLPDLLAMRREAWARGWCGCSAFAKAARRRASRPRCEPDRGDHQPSAGGAAHLAASRFKPKSCPGLRMHRIDIDYAE